MMALLKWGILALIAAVLVGCAASGKVCYPAPGTPIAWDGLGSPPNNAIEHMPKRQPKTEAVSEPAYDATASSDLKPYSQEWWAQREAADRAADTVLSRKLIICSGC